MVDFSTYQPPGAYVEEDSTPLGTSGGTIPQVVTLVGPGLGYLQATTNVVVSSASPTVLANAVSYATGPNAPVVTKSDGTVLVANTDYSASVDANGFLNLQRLAGSTAIADGATVTVTYRWTVSTYYSPQLFTHYDEVVDVYGEPLFQPSAGQVAGSYPTNQIVSPMSFAARLAFANGATQVLCVATPTGSQSDINSGYTKIETDQRVSVVVPLLFSVDGTGTSLITGPSQASGYATDLKTHCENAASDGLPRIGVLGMPKGFTGAGGYNNVVTVATGVASKRVIIPFPADLTYYNGYTNQTLTVDGFYLASAVAGLLESLDPNMPLTKKVIGGFSGIPSAVLQVMTRSAKDTLAQAGVAVVEQDRFGRLVVRHGVTTDFNGGLYTREISLVRQRDALFSLLQTGLDASNLIGTPITTETPYSVKSIIAGLLTQAENLEAILSWDNLQVRVASTDPSVIQVKFSYTPAMPLNYVTVSFTLNVSTGDFTSTDLTTVQG